MAGLRAAALSFCGFAVDATEVVNGAERVAVVESNLSRPRDAASRIATDLSWCAKQRPCKTKPRRAIHEYAAKREAETRYGDWCRPAVGTGGAGQSHGREGNQVVAGQIATAGCRHAAITAQAVNRLK